MEPDMLLGSPSDITPHAAAEQAADRQAAPDIYGTAKIMVVDDEPVVTKAVRKFLKMAGYANVNTATDPARRWSWFVRNRPISSCSTL